MGRRLPHPYNWVLAGMVIGAVGAAVTTGDKRLVMFVASLAGAIAGAVAASFAKKRCARPKLGKAVRQGRS